MLHLFLITGRRREDICGLKWDKINFENGIVCIDTALLYLPKLGIYESTTKTENTTFLPLPKETMQLLREYRAWYNELRLKKRRPLAGQRLSVRQKRRRTDPRGQLCGLAAQIHEATRPPAPAPTRVPAYKRFHADWKRRRRGHSRKPTGAFRCVHNAGYLFPRDQRSKGESI